MKAFYNRLKKRLPSRLNIYKYSIALLVLVFFTTYVGHALGKQMAAIPENPMEGYAKSSSQVKLASNYSHSKNVDEAKSKDKIEGNKQEEKQETKEEVKGDVKEEKSEKTGKIEGDPKATEKKRQQEQTESAQKQQAEPARYDNEAAINISDSKDKRSDAAQGIQSEGNSQSAQMPGSGNGGQGPTGNRNPGAGAGSGQEERQPEPDKPKEDKPEEKNGQNSEDKEIVNPDKENEHLQKNDYFTTTIVDGEIVTKADYSFAVKQKQHEYAVNEMKVFLNGGPVTDFSGTVTLGQGDNDIEVQISYQDQKGKIFTVSKSYKVRLEQGETIIYSSLEEEMEVTKADLAFTASAQRDGEEHDITVFANGEEVMAGRDGKYNVILNKGVNKIAISAFGDEGTSVEREYTVFYKQKETTLKIQTDLKDREVVVSKLDFRATAIDESEPARLTVEVNGELASGDEQGNYSVILKEGSNKVILKAYSGSDTLIAEYKIAYVKPIGQEESNVEEEKDAPLIVTDLVDGLTIKGTIKTFNVFPVDHEGNRIRGKNVSVTANGAGVPFIWDDSTKTSYKLKLREGKNEVVVRAWDSEGRTATETFYVHATAVAEGESIGKATISIEATTVGLGYLIPPTEVEIHQGERTSYILDQLLRDNGFTYNYTGNHDEGFYLSAIQKPGLVADPTIPPDLLELVRDASTRFDEEDYDTDWLGEFDFANGSGWMYSVNGDYPNFGFADSYLLDGDVVRIRYTLHYGKDIGGFGSMGGGAGEDWHKEW